MDTETFDLEEERLVDEVRRRGPKRVLVQLPEGLKGEGPRLASIIEKAGALPIISADPCYGACDLAIPEAESLSADLIVHYGHSEISRWGEPSVVYFEAKAKVDVRRIVKEALPLLRSWERIGLVTTVQHADKLEEVRRIFNDAGKAVAVGDAGRVKYPGQITGCDYSNAESVRDQVDAFLFIGGGRFHPLGLALDVRKPTVVADPYEGRAYSVEQEAERLIRKRWACISIAKELKYFGVLIGLKIGQTDLEKAAKIKDLLVKKGRKATLLALKEINNRALLQFPSLEAFVNTACPRVAFDEFQKPVLTMKEALVVLGKLSWDDLLKEGWFRNLP
jgi:2-(3-amino-3-carboxypropyl)histidine synthase